MIQIFTVPQNPVSDRTLTAYSFQINKRPYDHVWPPFVFPWKLKTPNTRTTVSEDNCWFTKEISVADITAISSVSLPVFSSRTAAANYFSCASFPSIAWPKVLPWCFSSNVALDVISVISFVSGSKENVFESLWGRKLVREIRLDDPNTTLPLLASPSSSGEGPAQLVVVCSFWSLCLRMYMSRNPTIISDSIEPIIAATTLLSCEPFFSALSMIDVSEVEGWDVSPPGTRLVLLDFLSSGLIDVVFVWMAINVDEGINEEVTSFNLVCEVDILCVPRFCVMLLSIGGAVELLIRWLVWLVRIVVMDFRTLDLTVGVFDELVRVDALSVFTESIPGSVIWLVCSEGVEILGSSGVFPSTLVVVVVLTDGISDSCSKVDGCRVANWVFWVMLPVVTSVVMICSSDFTVLIAAIGRKRMKVKLVILASDLLLHTPGASH